MKNKSDASLEQPLFNSLQASGPTQIGDRFVGKCYASSGEPVYFTMQKITPENQPCWKQYVEASKIMVGYNHQLLVYLAKHTVKVESSFAPVCYKFSEPYTEELAKKTGYSESEFNDFINFLGQRGFHAAAEQKLYALSGNAEGSEQIFLHIGNYIVYASKIENFSIEHIPLLPENCIMTLKAFREHYSDLLMCVSSWPSAYNSLQNRGIFKNPGCVVLDGGYSNISLAAHGFIAAVGMIFLNLEKITVQPVSSMQHMILESIPEKDISFCSEDPKAAYIMAKQISGNFRTSTKVHQFNIINSNALAQIFYKHAVTPKKLLPNENSFFSSIFGQQTEMGAENTVDPGCCIIF